jgi:dipeptide/tripeptide permease
MASGLSMGAQEAPADLKAEMMVEWLTGEAGGLKVCYLSQSESSDIAGPTRGRTYSSLDTSW